MLKSFFMCGIGLLMLPLGLLAQLTDNPYRNFYRTGAYHWTDSLRWTSVSVATAAGITPQGDSVANTTALRQLMATVHANGGGVIYFPAGQYHFADTLELPSDVILRGERPAVRAAKDSAYRPASQLVFPKYIPSLSGNGTPIQTAFKWITCVANAKNVGVVDLDINRARLFFMPKQYYFNPNPKGTVTVGGVTGIYLPADQPENVLILGVRQNNAAFPDPGVPNASQNAWQRWCYRFGNNIDVNARRNAVVCNNRLNDAPTDNYLQPGYTGNGCTATPALPADGSASVFNYTDHYGITVNRLKLLMTLGSGARSSSANYGNILLALPEDEPYFYAPGNEVNDNWVYKTSRVAIYAAGNGLQLRRNEMHDRPDKVVWVQPSGTACNVVGSTTYENRGIDFSGWNLYVDSNQVEVYNNRIKNGPYHTPDGEFLLLQECCGGTPVNGYHITHNVGNSYIGLYKVRDIANAEISFNRPSPPNNSNFASGIFVDANTATPGAPGNLTPYSITNTTIEGNVITNGMTVTGAKGGRNVIVKDNVCRDNTNLTVSCYVQLQNNTGFRATVLKELVDNATTTTPCDEDVTLPAIAGILPTHDTIIDFAALRPTLPITIKCTMGIPEQLKVSLYANGVKIAGGLVFSNLIDSTLSFDWPIPQVANQTYYISARGVDTALAVATYSAPIKVEVQLVEAIAHRLSDGAGLSVYPSPAHGSVTVSRTEAGLGQLTLYGVDGRVQLQKPMQRDAATARLDVSHLPAGVYMLRYQSAHSCISRQFVVE